MPGIIQISVLETVDLPEVLTDGTTLKGFTARVTLGTRLFKTQPGVPDGGKIKAFNSDFLFPVMNLHDKLVVSICDSEDRSVSQTAIELPYIIQKGNRDEFLSLNNGGRIHVRMSFILTEKERQKIAAMRVAAMKRRAEADRSKKTVIFQPFQAPMERPVTKSAVPRRATVDVDIPTSYEEKVLKEQPNLSVGLDSTPKPQKEPNSTSKPMFNYAKAIGIQPGLEFVERKSMFVVPDNLIKEVMVCNGNANSGVVDACSVIKVEVLSAASSGRSNGSSPLVTESRACMPQSNPTPPGGLASLRKEEVGEYDVENAGEFGSPEIAQSHIKSSGSLGTKTTCNTYPSEDLSPEVNPTRSNRNSEAETGRDSAYAASILHSSVIDASPVNGLGAASSGITSRESTSNILGPITTRKAVKARVKKTYLKVFCRRSPRRASSRIVVTHTQRPVLVSWLQEQARRAFLYAKGCCAPT